MRISHIEVDGFKSLVGFKMDLSKLTCLIGLNGSGKSTVLQFLDFLGRLMQGNLVAWLDERGWEKSSVCTDGAIEKRIAFRVSVRDGDAVLTTWSGIYDAETMRCVEESIAVDESVSFESNDRRYTIRCGNPEDTANDIVFDFCGSVVSQLRSDRLPQPIRELRSFFANLQSPGSFDPVTLRSPRAVKRTGSGWNNLAGRIAGLLPEALGEVLSNVKRFYPGVASIAVEEAGFGRKELILTERIGTETGRVVARNATGISDTMLRLLAVLAEMAADRTVVLFDEIENGIDPEATEVLIKLLVHAKHQVILATHSPLLLNYLEDEQAKQSVMYVYKTDAGESHAVAFFDIASMEEKLRVLGPGEVFIDTILSRLDPTVLVPMELAAQ